MWKCGSAKIECERVKKKFYLRNLVTVVETSIPFWSRGGNVGQDAVLELRVSCDAETSIVKYTYSYMNFVTLFYDFIKPNYCFSDFEWTQGDAFQQSPRVVYCWPKLGINLLKVPQKRECANYVNVPHIFDLSNLERFDLLTHWWNEKENSES